MGGLYRLTCTDCCARLLRSARRFGAGQQAMLDHIGRLDTAPPRAVIAQRLRELYPKTSTQPTPRSTP